MTEHTYCWSVDALGSYPAMHREPRYLNCKCRCGGIGLVRRVTPADLPRGPHWRFKRNLGIAEVACSNCHASTGKCTSACGAIDQWNKGKVVMIR